MHMPEARPERTSGMTSERLEHFRRRLETERDRLIDDTKILLAEARGTGADVAKNSPAEIGSESFTRDTEFGEASLDQSILNEILEALNRINEGSYGVCQLSGCEIPEERLETVPWTRFSVESQRAVEEAQPGDPGRGKGGQLVGELEPLRNPPRFGSSPAGAETQS